MFCVTLCSLTNLEEPRTTLLRKQFETNLFGLMDVTTAFLPYLRASRDSTLVVIGSRSAWKPEIPVRDTVAECF